MKYLVAILLVMTLQGCMLFGEHGRHGMQHHDKTADSPAHPH